MRRSTGANGRNGGLGRATGLALAATLAALGPGWAQGADGVAIQEIRTQAFLERSGRWSEDLSAAKKPQRNLGLAASPLGERADALLVTLVFAAPKGYDASRGLARDMAQVSVKQVKGEVTRTLLYRAYGGFTFNDEGRAHKAFLLDEATCAPLEIEVKVGRSRRQEKLDLVCDEPAKAEPAAAKPAAKRR